MSVGNEEEMGEIQEGDDDSFCRYEKIVSQYAVSVRSRTLDISIHFLFKIQNKISGLFIFVNRFF